MEQSQIYIVNYTLSSPMPKTCITKNQNNSDSLLCYGSSAVSHRDLVSPLLSKSTPTGLFILILLVTHVTSLEAM